MLVFTSWKFRSGYSLWDKGVSNVIGKEIPRLGPDDLKANSTGCGILIGIVICGHNIRYRLDSELF